MRGVKRKKPPMIQGVHGIDLGGGRVHLWGPRFCDIGVHRNLRRMFKEQAPIQVDPSEDECVEVVSTLPSPRDADIAREAEAALGPLETELEEKMSRDGQNATHIIHMGQALKVVREVLQPARTWIAGEHETREGYAFSFDYSDIARIHDEVMRLFYLLRNTDAP